MSIFWVCLAGLLLWLVIMAAAVAWIRRPRRLEKNWHDRTNTMLITHADGQQVRYTGNRRAVMIDWSDIVSVEEER